MKRTRRSRRRKANSYQDPGISATAQTLEQIGGLAETLERILQGQLGDLVSKVLILEEALEMNYWVQMRLTLEGFLAPGADPEELVSRSQELQEEYLAVTSVALFLSDLGYLDQVEEVDSAPR